MSDTKQLGRNHTNQKLLVLSMQVLAKTIHRWTKRKNHSILTLCHDAKPHQTSWVPLTLRQTCCQEFPDSAICVQNINDSRGIAIRTTYRISLRSSSLRDPRHPLLKVVVYSTVARHNLAQKHITKAFTTGGGWDGFHKNCGTSRSKERTAQHTLVHRPQLHIAKIVDLGVVMILPQVHLRKPCYDFTFL